MKKVYTLMLHTGTREYVAKADTVAEAAAIRQQVLDGTGEIEITVASAGLRHTRGILSTTVPARAIEMVAIIEEHE